MFSSCCFRVFSFFLFPWYYYYCFFDVFWLYLRDNKDEEDLITWKKRYKCRRDSVSFRPKCLTTPNIVCIVQYKEQSFQLYHSWKGRKNILYVLCTQKKERKRSGKHDTEKWKSEIKWKQQQQQGKFSIIRQEAGGKQKVSFRIFFSSRFVPSQFCENIIQCVFYRISYSVDFLSLSRLLRFSITRGSFIDTGLGFVYCVVYFTVSTNYIVFDIYKYIKYQKFKGYR